ncbi:MAG: PAS domain S-box protein, partial [Anaerolineales bacterium]
MIKPLAVLIVEDSESDTQLIVRLLKKAGYKVTSGQVETAAQMRAALEKQAWEIVISDYSLPEFDGHAALMLLRETGLDIPFIAVSGTMGEETAVDMMKAGAHDYVMKGNLARLVPAVERELIQARVRRERKRAEREIANLAKFPFESPGPVLRLSQDGIVMYANPASDALLHECGCVIGGFAPQFWRDLVAQALANEETKTVEMESDGKVYSMFVAPIAGMGYVNIYGQDISERKQAEEALKESEAKFRSYIEYAPLGVFIVDRSGRYLEVNAAAAEMLGYTETEFLHLSIPDVLAPQSLEAGLQQFQAVVQDGFSTSELLLRRKEGAQFWATVDAVKLSEDRFMSYCQDITERKQAEEKLSNAREFLQSVQDALSMHIAILD